MAIESTAAALLAVSALSLSHHHACARLLEAYPQHSNKLRTSLQCMAVLLLCANIRQRRLCITTLESRLMLLLLLVLRVMLSSLLHMRLLLLLPPLLLLLLVCAEDKGFQRQ